MRIASLLARVRPEQVEIVRDHLARIPGVSLFGTTPDGGRLIVMVEDGEGYAVSDAILAVSIAPGVLGTTLAYEYSDDATDPADLVAAFARRTLQESRV